MTTTVVPGRQADEHRSQDVEGARGAPEALLVLRGAAFHRST